MRDGEFPETSGGSAFFWPPGTVSCGLPGSVKFCVGSGLRGMREECVESPRSLTEDALPGYSSTAPRFISATGTSSPST